MNTAKEVNKNWSYGRTKSKNCKRGFDGGQIQNDENMKRQESKKTKKQLQKTITPPFPKLWKNPFWEILDQGQCQQQA